MLLKGVFINLDRSRERRTYMERQLHDLGCGDWVARFPAVDGSTSGPFDNAAENGIWACRQSHARAISDSDDASALLVMEDDVEISRHFPAVVNQHVVSEFIRTYPNCDVLFLDCVSFQAQTPFLLHLSELQMKNRLRNDCPSSERHSFQSVNIIDARGVYAYCAGSYIVTPKGKEVLRQLFAENPDPRMAVDILYRNWIAEGRINAHLTIPFLATPQFRNMSTIPYGELDYLHIDQKTLPLVSAIRRLLFAGDHGLNMTEISAMLREVDSSHEYKLGMQLYETGRASE